MGDAELGKRPIEMVKLVAMSYTEVVRHVDALTVGEYRELRERIRKEFEDMEKYKERLIVFHNTVKDRANK